MGAESTGREATLRAMMFFASRGAQPDTEVGPTGSSAPSDVSSRDADPAARPPGVRRRLPRLRWVVALVVAFAVLMPAGGTFWTDVWKPALERRSRDLHRLAREQ